MSALHIDRVATTPEGRVESLSLQTGEKVVLRGPRDRLEAIYSVISGRGAAGSRAMSLLGAPHPGPDVRHRRWAARVALSRGELHLVENVDLLRNLTVPMVYTLGIRPARAEALAREAFHDLGLTRWMHARPVDAPNHVRQMVHIARATVPGRELSILLDPQEGMLADQASATIGFLLSDSPTAVILCSEGWLEPPDGFTERQLELRA